MKIYYDKESKGFYSSEINGDKIPSGSVEIARAYHAELLTGQGGGKVIVADEHGYPILEIPRPMPPQPPKKVTMRQARLAIHAEGMLDRVESAINALDEPARTESRIEWDYSSEVFRDNPFVKMLGQSLGLTDDRIDEIFIRAASL